MTEVIHREAAKARSKNNVKFKLNTASINEQSTSSGLVCSLTDNNISNLKKDHDVSKTSQLLSNQYLPSNLKPLEAAVENSSPLGYWTKPTEQIGTRSAVDKYTLSRYSPSEWHLHNQILSKEMEQPIDNSKAIAYSIRLAENDIFNQVDKNKLETETHLKDRARIIYNWKLILESNIQETVDEIRNVQEIIEQLLKSNYAVTLVNNINHDIQKVRNERLELELVHDSVSEEIIKEGALCKEILNLYTRIIKEGKQYIQELKDTKQKLEQDWSDKKDTYNIETECIGLKSGSPTVYWKPGCAQLPDKQYHLTGYEYVSRDNIALNQTAIIRAKIFCKIAKDMVEKAVRDLRFQAGQVNTAFRKRNFETQKACQYLESDLIECLKSISNSEANIIKTSKSIGKLDDPMKCAQTKLHMLSQRQNIEQCRDFSQICLIDEMKDISAGVSALNILTKSAEMTLEDLRKLQRKIQKEIMIRQKTIWVDQDMCQHIRSYYPLDQDLRGY